MANIRTGRKSGFIVRNGVSRRETAWIGSDCVSQAMPVPGTPFLVLSLNAAALAQRPFTVVRTRGILYATTDQLAASEAWGVFVGISVVSDQASAIGVTAVPTPATDMSSDMFLLHDAVFGRVDLATAVGFNNVGAQKELDSKAMRRVEDGQDLVTVLETCDETGFLGASVLLYTRTLIKLH